MDAIKDFLWEIKFMWDDGLAGKALTIALALVLLALPVLMWQAHQAEKAWKKYVVEHNCKIVGQMSGDVSTGVGFVVSPSGVPTTGMVTVATSGKTGYQCDDGITYWR